MASFDEWSDEAEAEVNGHRLRLVTLLDGHGAVAQEKAVEILTDHYDLKSCIPASRLGMGGSKDTSESDVSACHTVLNQSEDAHDTLRNADPPDLRVTLGRKLFL